MSVNTYIVGTTFIVISALLTGYYVDHYLFCRHDIHCHNILTRYSVYQYLYCRHDIHCNTRIAILWVNTYTVGTIFIVIPALLTGYYVGQYRIYCRHDIHCHNIRTINSLFCGSIPILSAR